VSCTRISWSSQWALSQMKHRVIYSLITHWRKWTLIGKHILMYLLNCYSLYLFLYTIQYNLLQIMYLYLHIDSQPTATELFQLPLYGSGTVFRSISHLLHLFYLLKFCSRLLFVFSVVSETTIKNPHFVLLLLPTAVTSEALVILWPKVWKLASKCFWATHMIICLLVLTQ